MSKADFKKWTDLDKDSPQAQKLLQPIPIQYEMAHFGCRRNNQPKEHAKELLIRFLGPGASYDLNETKLRMFGAIDDNPYSTSRNSMKGAEPRPYLKIHTYEMTAEGKLTYESVDLLQACIDFYGTDDLMKMKEKNSFVYFTADDKIGCIDDQGFFFYELISQRTKRLRKYLTLDQRDYYVKCKSKSDSLEYAAKSMLEAAKYFIRKDYFSN